MQALVTQALLTLANNTLPNPGVMKSSVLMFKLVLSNHPSLYLWH